MKRTHLMLIGAGASVLVGGLAWTSYNRLFAGPVAEARARALDLSTDIQALQRGVASGKSARDELGLIAAASLGSNREEVVHELRVALTEIGAMAGLTGVVVDSRAVSDLRSPAAKVFSNSKALREQADFSVVEGTLRGNGSYAQAARVLAVIESQAWPQRIRSIIVEPSSSEKGGDQSVTVNVETMFLPDLASKVKQPAGDRRAIASIEPARAAVLDRVSSRDLFARAREASVVDLPTAIPQAAPSQEWIVTGWAEGSAGWELWVRNTRDQQSRSVRVGETLLDTTFVEVRNGYAVVDAGGQKFAIGMGEGMTARERRIE